MNLSSPFITRPIATSLLMIAILLAGILAFQFLPVSALPEVEYPTIQVLTFYPGASPEVMTSSVTAPLEKQFGQMPGLNQMTSTSSSGMSLITLQFNLKMSLDIAEQQVQAAINAATSYLPGDLPNPPIYSKVNPADVPIVTLGITSKSIPLPKVEDYTDTHIAQKISQLPGVGLVTLSGGQRPAIRIQANPTALASYGLSLEDLRLAVTTANVNIAKGSFDGQKQSYTINANDQLLTRDAYASLIIAYKNGMPIRVADIGQVVASAENVRQAAWMNKTPAVIMNIQRQPGANVIEVVDRIKQLLPTLKASIPEAIDISIISDRTNTIRNSIAVAEFEMILSILLVVLVIFVFLRSFKATFIPSMAVPLSIIGTFGAMYCLGFSINNLTLMALTIATGFVVDDAIVMIENISRFIEQGEKPFTAALLGAKQIGFTIVSLTFSLIAVLIPLLFMRDVIGRLFREFALTVTVTILISAFVSLTLTPMLCARILHRDIGTNKNPINIFMGNMQTVVMNFYRTSLDRVLHHQRLVLSIVVVTFVINGLLIYIISKGFFPVQDTGVILGISEAPQTISYEAMKQKQQALADIILADPAVSDLSSFIGIDGINTTLNTGRFLISLKPLAQRKIDAQQIIDRLNRQSGTIPGIKLYLQSVQDLSIEDRVSRTQYQYSINSPNIDEVNKWTDLLTTALKDSNAFQIITNDLQNLGLQTTINVDRDAASRFGITQQLIDNTLYDAFGQRQISTMFTQINQYHVILEVLPYLQNNPHRLENIYLKSNSGMTVPLSAIAQVAEKVSPLIINRQGQFPVAIVSFNLAQNYALSDATHIISKMKKSISMPDSLQTSFEGAAKIYQNSLANEAFLIIAAILVVYIVLGVLYESYIHPITILSTLSSAAMGALLALMLTRNNLDVIALIGIILLIGIVMKNAIMMIDFALELERIEKKSPQEAIYAACLLRFRPIIMTTMASLLGAMPLAFGSGMGTELRQPLGIVILGGLIVSQILTLYTTPVIYLFFARISTKLAQPDNRHNQPTSSTG